MSPYRNELSHPPGKVAALITAQRLLVIGFSALAAGGAHAGELAAHRAAYDVTLIDSFTSGLADKKGSAVAARGLIGYEFRGSACEGYTSNFRMAAEIEQAEGDSIKLGQKSLTFEEAKSAGLRFQIEDITNDKTSDVTGYAARDTGGEVAVDLKKPKTGHADLGKDVLFPTEHIQHILAAAQAGQDKLEARVYDGSDSGEKVYQTLTIIGKKEGADQSAAAKPLAGHSRWPLTISYFDAATPDAQAEYIMAFDLYDNGVTGDLKIDYGSFAIGGKLASLELLPTAACKGG